MIPLPPENAQRGWERAAIFGLVAVILAGLIAVLIVGHDAENQIETMRDRLDAMAGRLDAMRTDARPWVSARIAIAGDLTIDDTGARLPLRYDLANSGQVPAFNVITTATLLPMAGGATLEPKRELEARCGNVLRIVSKAMQSGNIMSWDYAIFPGRQFAANDTATTKLAGAGVTAPTLIISCIDYRAGRAADHHQTGDVFYLRRVSGEPAGALVDIDLGRKERIPAAELRLVPASSGMYAN